MKSKFKNTYVYFMIYLTEYTDENNYRENNKSVHKFVKVANKTFMTTNIYDYDFTWIQ